MECPGEQIRFVCNVTSPLLAWSSAEFIGQPPGIRIEFTSLITVGTVIQGMNGTNATLLGVSGTNVTSSELHVFAVPATTASVTCEDNDGNQNTSLFQVPGMSIKQAKSD